MIGVLHVVAQITQLPRSGTSRHSVRLGATAIFLPCFVCVLIIVPVRLPSPEATPPGPMWEALL